MLSLVNLFYISDIFRGVIFLSLSSKVSIPIGPVPFTLQTLVLGYMFYKLDFSIFRDVVLTYITFGFLFKLFANVSGLASFGYVLAFYPYIYFMRFLSNYFYKTRLSILIHTFIGNLFISSFGMLFLMIYLNISFQKAFFLGFFPFIFSAFIKSIFLASFINLKSDH